MKHPKRQDFRHILGRLCIIYLLVLVILLIFKSTLNSLHPTLTLLYVALPYWFIPIAILLPLALFLRSTLATISLLGVLSIFIIQFGLYGPIISYFMAPKSEVNLSLATYNLGPGQAQPHQILEAIRRVDADIIGVQELTSPVQDTLEMNLPEYPHRLFQSEQLSVGLLSKHPVVEANWIHPECGERAFLHAVIALDEDQLNLLVVHPTPPDVLLVKNTLLPFGVDDENQACQVASILKYSSGLNGHIVMMGDFNGTPSTSAYELVIQSYTDSHFNNNQSLGFSFPQDVCIEGIELPGPLIRIDYIFHSGELIARSNSTHCLPGSNHCLVLAEIVLP